ATYVAGSTVHHLEPGVDRLRHRANLAVMELHIVVRTIPSSHPWSAGKCGEFPPICFAIPHPSRRGPVDLSYRVRGVGRGTATGCSVAQYLHLCAASGISDKHSSHALVVGSAPNTLTPRRAWMCL